VCNFKRQCDDLKSQINKSVPEATVVCQIGRRGSFEVVIDEKLVHSKLSTIAFPDYQEVVKNVQNAANGLPVETVKEQPITDCVVQ
jgi:selenoprotein W-related protein